MSTSTQPRVSIGMPVYNGDRFLRKALSTLLAQDYSNFELIISDNNSRDSTGDICREFEAADPRIRYIRHAENRGSPWNFAFVLEQAQGDYFMWAAHDDMWHPTYIGKCLRTLQARPDAILCCTEVNFVGGEDEASPHYVGWKNLDTSGMSPLGRIHQMIAQMGWYAIYGLLRSEAIRKVKGLEAGIYGNDVVVLMELILMGHFVKIPEPLFSARIVKPKTATDFQVDFNSERNPLPPTPIPYTGLAAKLLSTVYQSNLSPGEKTACFADFVRTMTAQNRDRFWRAQITQELLGPNVELNDAGFAFLLGQVLARSIPLTEIGHNPFLQAVYSPLQNVPDILGLATAVLANQRPSAAEKQRQGILLFEQGKIEEASCFFAEALKMEETSARWVDWATTQIARNRTSEAEQGLHRALKLDANHTLAALKLGILMANQGRFESAVPFLERSLAGSQDRERRDVVRLIEDCRAKAASAGQFATPLS